jgi:nicotinate-nucleotide pyrophosphorylase (carboxylating)
MRKYIQEIIALALREDIPQGDITSLAIFGAKKTKAHGVFKAKQNLILSGVDVAEMIFKKISPQIRFHSLKKNGAKVLKGQKIATVTGPVDLLLKGERVALNFLQQLSGVATLTRQFVDAIKPYKAHIMDTRKTIPGLRLLQKRAVMHGGGVNHRMSLSDMYLVKDNHIAACGSMRLAIQKIQASEGHSPPPGGGGWSKGRSPKTGRGGKLIEVEADTLAQVQEALASGVDMILLDNMTPAQIKKAVQIIAGKLDEPQEGRHIVSPLLEVSGGVNLKNVRKFAATGVARISIGALTHSAPAVDISLDMR